MDKLIVIASAGLILFLSFAAYFYYRVTHMFVYQEMAKGMTVSSEWIVINPQSLMKQNRRFQAVALMIDGLKTGSKNRNLILPDGTVIKPEIEIVDEFGNKYNLESLGINAMPSDSEPDTLEVSQVHFKIKGGRLPKGRNYTELRIRNNKPFVARKIYWLNYDLK